MASPTEIARFRRLLGGTDLTDEQLDMYLTDNDGNMNKAGHEYWQGMAGKYSHLVTVSENQSRRELSDLFAHAMKMVEQFKAAVDAEEIIAVEGTSGTREIERL